MVHQRIKELRESLRTSQGDLATRIGIAQSSIGNYERGDRLPDADVVCKLARYFDVSADYLLGLSKYQNLAEFENLHEKYADISSRMTAQDPFSKKYLLSLFENLVDCYKYLESFSDTKLDLIVLNYLTEAINYLKKCCNNAYSISSDEGRKPAISDLVEDANNDRQKAVAALISAFSLVENETVKRFYVAKQ